MLYILTSDLFLYNGLKKVYGDRNVTRSSDIEEVKRKHVSTDSLLIDTLYSRRTGAEYLDSVQALLLSRIILLSSFRLTRFKSQSPVIFLPRDIHPDELSGCPEMLVHVAVARLPSLTLIEYKIITQLIKYSTDTAVADSLGITVTTLRAHKYQLMLKLKLRKMSHILHTEHYACITGLRPEAGAR